MTGPQRRFGDYVLLGALGRGGMGEVYLAKKGGLAGAERLCVIKTLRDDRANEPEYVRRFLDEARVVVSLQHAGVCHVFDVGVTDGAYFLAMEHIPGLTLRVLFDALASKGRAMPPAVAVHIGISLLEALDSAHRHHHPITGVPLHIVHRDVSPQNVMLSFGGDVKLIDFGLAQSSLKIEQTGRDVVYGKLMYMSPEQARGEALDGRSDQFSAAILLTELLTGERYWGELEPVVIHRHLHEGGFTPPGHSRIPPEIAAVLAMALSPEKEHRYATCADAAAALRALVGRVVPAVGGPDVRALLVATVPEEIAGEQARITELLQREANGESSGSFRVPPDTLPVGPGSQPTGTIAVGRRQTSTARPWLGAALAGVGVAIGVVATIALQAGRDPVEPAVPPPVVALVTDAPPVPSAPPVPPPVNVPVVPATPVGADAGVEAAPPPPAPVAVEPAPSSRPHRRPKPAPSPPPPTTTAPVARASDKQKRSVMGWCTKKCAAAILTQIEKNPDFSGPALDKCYDLCRSAP